MSDETEHVPPHNIHAHSPTRTLTVWQVSKESFSDRLELRRPEDVDNEFA
jgi:hypothetical protein